LGIPVLEGREFAETDRAETRPVIVISQQFADRFWPGISPLGQMIDDAEVVGVAANASYRSLVPDQEEFPNDPDVFIPIVRNAPASLQVAVRGSVDPTELAQIIRSEVHGLDPMLPIFGVTTLADLVEAQVGASRAATQQLGAFAIIALLLAVGGLFGVMAYSVGRQAGEIGLRMALGATSRRIRMVFLGRAMGLVLAGVLIGVTLSIAVVRVLDSQLYGVASNDWTTYSAAGGLFLIVGLAACLMPALRATRIDPLLALRSE